MSEGWCMRCPEQSDSKTCGNTEQIVNSQLSIINWNERSLHSCIPSFINLSPSSLTYCHTESTENTEISSLRDLWTSVCCLVVRHCILEFCLQNYKISVISVISVWPLLTIKFCVKQWKSNGQLSNRCCKSSPPSSQPFLAQSLCRVALLTGSDSVIP